jgi:hypothetical protein
VVILSGLSGPDCRTVRAAGGTITTEDLAVTTITVLPTAPGVAGYRAVAGAAEATGATPGQAIDALVARSGGSDGPTIIIVQPAGADEFFTADQQARLADLMVRWRTARDAGEKLPADEQAELDTLIAAELRAATARTAAALRAVRP